MPTFEIIQRLYYKPSELERMIEKNLSQHKLFLSQPVTIGKKFEYIHDGLRRELKYGNKLITYMKFFRDTNWFIKQLENDPLKNSCVDEPQLVQILNSNKLYSEDVKLTDETVDVTLVHYPTTNKAAKYEIDCSEELSVDLFVRVVNNYYEIDIDVELFKDRLKTDSVEIKEMGNIIQQIAPHILRPTSKDYVNMMVKYLVK